MGKTKRRSGAHGLLVLVAVGVLGGVRGHAERISSTAAVPPPPAAEPITCWWRTSASDVRVGETFSVVLTCVVVDDATTEVVADQLSLDPSAIQFQPFEVVGGTHAQDVRADGRRFFQYQYTLRLIADDLIGKDVSLPPVQIGYRIRTRTRQGEALEGRDQTYRLPPESIRLLSIVPVQASDIRDAADETFTDLQGRRSRTNVLLVIGGLLTGLGSLLLIVTLVRLMRQYRAHVPSITRLIPDRTILRGVSRELAAVERQRRLEGWTPDLTGRALTSLRIAASYALARSVSQFAAANGTNGHEGQLLVRGGWRRGKPVLVSGAVTAAVLAQELARQAAQSSHGGGRAQELLEQMQIGLQQLTAAQYGRSTKGDGDALDSSLAAGLKLLRRLRVQQSWPVREAAAFGRAATAFGRRLWPK